MSAPDERGRIGIRAEPLTNGFAAQLKAFLDGVERDLRLQVPLSLETTQARADLARLQADLDSSAVEIQAGLNTDAARAELDRLKSTVASTSADIKVGVDKSKTDSDVSSIRSGLSTLASIARSIVIGASFAAVGAGLAVAVVQGIALVSVLAQAAGAAALIPAALAGLAAVGAATFIGLSGVGDALKASGKASTPTGGGNPNAAADSARQVAAAQRGLASAYRQVADERVADAKRITDAEQAIKDAQANATDTHASDVQAITDAENTYVKSQHDELRAQQDLNDARAAAAQQIQDLKVALSGASVDQETAALDLAKAQKELADVQGNDFSTDLEKSAAQVAVDQAAQKVAETAQNYKDLQAKSATANAEGVSGAANVVAAQDRLTNAVQSTADAQAAIGKARKQESDDQVSGARAIAKAQADLAAAQHQQAEDRISEQNSIIDAQDRLASAQEAAAKASTGGSAAQTAAAAAMAKLSPAGRELVQTLLNLGPAWQSVKFATQDALLGGLATKVQTLAGRALPVLRTGLSGVAGALNGSASALISFAGRSTTLSSVGVIFTDIRHTVQQLTPSLTPLAQALLDVIRVGAGFGPGLAAGFTRFATSVATAVSGAAGDGSLARFISSAITTLHELAEILINIGSVFVSVFSAGAESGGHLLAAIVTITARMAALARSAQGQAVLHTIFDTAEQAVRLLVAGLAAGGPVIERFFAGFGKGDGPAAASLASIKQSLQSLAPILGQAFVGNAAGTLNGILKITATVLSAVADHAGLLAKVLPFVAAGFAAMKLAQAAANLLGAAEIPIKAAQVVSNTLLAASNRALSRELAIQNAAQRANTVATDESTVATEEQTIAQRAGAIATRIFAAGQALLNAIMSANPIVLVVIAVVALVAAFILAYQHSEKFRQIVQAAFGAVLRAVQTAFNWVRDNWPLLLAILTGPIGLAVLVIHRHWQDIQDGATAVKQWITDKFDGVVGFFTALPGRIAKSAVGMFDKVTGLATDAKQWVTDHFDALVTYMIGLPGRIGRAELGLFDKAKDLATAAKQWITDRFDNAVSHVTGLPGRFSRAALGLFAGLQGYAATAHDYITGKFDAVVTTITGLPARITRAASGMWDGIKGAFHAVISDIVNLWNALQFTLPSVDTHIPGIGKIGGFTLGTPDIHIPGLSDGATVLPSLKGTLAILAEGGKPETVTDTGLTNKLIDNANRLAAKSLSGGDKNVTIINNYYVQDQDPVLLAAVVGREQARQAI